jgi:hypothetical protein
MFSRSFILFILTFATTANYGALAQEPLKSQQAEPPSAANDKLPQLPTPSTVVPRSEHETKATEYNSEQLRLIERERIADEHARKDLKAQEDAAQAAERNADAADSQTSAAWLQVVLSSLGILGLLYTLHLTRLSLEATRDAVSQDLRAYLFGRFHDLKISTLCVSELMFELKNGGHTPASGVSVALKVIVLPFPLKDTDKLEFDDPPALGQIMPPQDAIAAGKIDVFNFKNDTDLLEAGERKIH